ncbi:MAG TPA: hypothetical protein VK466_07570 [Terriglobales bacterium]|nr:hypothetical protein [Terriglobales bacterium]
MADEIVITTTTDGIHDVEEAVAERPPAPPAELEIESSSDSQAMVESALEDDEAAARRPWRDHPSFSEFRSFKSADGKLSGLSYEAPNSSRADAQAMLDQAEAELAAFAVPTLEELEESMPASSQTPAPASSPGIALLPSQLTDSQLEAVLLGNQVSEKERDALNVEHQQRVGQSLHFGMTRTANRVAALPEAEQAKVHAAYEYLNGVSPDLALACQLPENGPELASHLAQHPQIVSALMGMRTAQEAIGELSRISRSLLAASRNQAMPSRAAAPLPTPMKSIKGGTIRPSVPLEEMSYQDFKRQRERDIKNRYR